jgi:TPR repeat protein
VKLPPLIAGAILLVGTAAAQAQTTGGGGAPPANSGPAQAVSPQGLLPLSGAPSQQELPSTVSPDTGSSNQGLGQPGFGGTVGEPTIIPTLPDPDADYAYGAYQRGLYLTALREATRRAQSDRTDGAAMTLLGELYSQGLGVRQDFTKAADWYRPGDAAGDRNATFALAMMTFAGRGVAKDNDAALALLKRAAAEGHGPAMYNLAVVLMGSGKPDDLTQAVDLLRKAAEIEVPDAQYALAVLTKEGRGTEKNPAEAARWMARAAANDNLSAQVEYAIMLFNGDGVKADETRAARLFALAAGRGNAIAQNRLARILAAGRGMPKNLVEAASWHMMASQQGLADPWLDDALKDLAPADRSRAEALARRRTADLAANLQP